MKNRLKKLFKDNINNGAFRVSNDGDGSATVYLYDAIGGWYGVDAETFARDLAAIDANLIHLRVNSPGGDVFDARAMQAAIRQHKAKVIAHIDGYAASAAGFLILAADEIEMAPGAFLMIHQAWTAQVGNADEMRATADLLEKVDTSIVADFVNRSGKSAETVRAWMKAETWFTAAEALENGLVDRVNDSADTAENRFNLSAYKNVPERLLNRDAKPETPVFDRAAVERRMAFVERIGR